LARHQQYVPLPRLLLLPRPALQPHPPGHMVPPQRRLVPLRVVMRVWWRSRHVT
jgi:hypothetical protein